MAAMEQVPLLIWDALRQAGPVAGVVFAWLWLEQRKDTRALQAHKDAYLEKTITALVNVNNVLNATLAALKK